MAATAVCSPWRRFCKRLLLLLPALAFAHPRVATSIPETAPSEPRVVDCGKDGTRCLSLGQLPHENGSCYPLLERGPCQEDQWFLLDGGQTLRGHCVPRPCALGQLPFHGRCLTQTETHAQLCKGGAVHVDPTGIPRCGQHPGWPLLLNAFVRCPSTAPFKIPLDLDGRVVQTSGVLCAVKDNGECDTKVEGSSPVPVLKPE